MGLSPEALQRVRARVGTVLHGKWKLERVLGVGGMAAVYLGVHRNQKRVAVKMLHPELALDETIRNRFLREGYAANTVEHPGTVPVFDDDVTEDGAAYLVMELLEGETLDARAERKGRQLPLGEVLSMADQLLDVLAAAHEKGIVHRDVKPENLFLTTSGQLKVLDFGIARLRESTLGEGSTAVGSFMGTPAFMAPEQARGRWEEVDAQSDLWAVGATLFTLLSAEHVHAAETVNDQLVLSATARARPIISVLPELPRPIASVIDRALEFEKGARWPSARAMQQALRAAALGVSDGAPLLTPRSSFVRWDEAADTLAAAPDVPAGSGSGQRVSHGTSATAAVTSSRGPASTLSRPARYAALGALVAVALVGAIWTMALGRKGDARPPLTTLPGPAASPAQAPGSVRPEPPGPSVTAVDPSAEPIRAEGAEVAAAASTDDPAKDAGLMADGDGGTDGVAARTNTIAQRPTIVRPKSPATTSASAAPGKAPPRGAATGPRSVFDSRF